MRLFGKKVMDEREQMEMYREEHYAFWVLYWAQAVSLAIRKLILDEPFIDHAWEWGVFLAVSVWLIIISIRKGNYDYYTEPGWKSYLAYSVVFSLLFGAVAIGAGVYKGWIESVGDALLISVIEVPFLFVVCYGALAAVGTLAKRRRKKLEEAFDEEE